MCYSHLASQRGPLFRYLTFFYMGIFKKFPVGKQQRSMNTSEAKIMFSGVLESHVCNPL